MDLSQLCVKEGRKCWALYLDALLLSRDGNVLDACSIAFKVRGIDHHQSFGAIREESRTTMMNLMCDVAEYLVEVGGMSRVSCTYMSMCMSMYMSMYVYMLYQSYMMMRLSSKKCGHHCNICDVTN